MADQLARSVGKPSGTSHASVTFRIQRCLALLGGLMPMTTLDALLMALRCVSWPPTHSVMRSMRPRSQ